MADKPVELYDFWFSATYKEWLLRTGNAKKLTVLLDGNRQEYTRCCAHGKKEPYSHALTIFPDYRIISTDTMAATATTRRVGK